MEWDFEFLPDLGIVSVRTSGDLDYDRMLEFIEAAAAAMEKHGVNRILVDHRDAVLRISPTRVYRIPAVEVAHGLDRRHRVAVVYSAQTMRDEDVSNYESVMRTATPFLTACSTIPTLRWPGPSNASDARRPRRYGLRARTVMFKYEHQTRRSSK